MRKLKIRWIRRLKTHTIQAHADQFKAIIYKDKSPFQQDKFSECSLTLHLNAFLFETLSNLQFLPNLVDST